MWSKTRSDRRSICSVDIQGGGAVPIHRSTLTAIGVAACCVCSMVTPPAVAQSRFEVLGAESVAAIEGLNVYTIRDNQMASCYTVFVIHPADAPTTSLAFQ